jgi:hypothetical protein
MTTTTAIIILNVVFVTGILGAIVTLCAGAILTSPEQERRHRLGRLRTVRAQRTATPRAATTGAFARRPSYEA